MGLLAAWTKFQTRARKAINYEQIDDALIVYPAPLALTRIAPVEPVWLVTLKGY